MLNLGSIIAKFEMGISLDEDFGQSTSTGQNDPVNMDPIVTFIFIISIALEMFLLVMCCVSKDFFAKRKLAQRSRFATLRV